MRRLEGKVAIVTGGAGRIGKAVSHRLASEGAKVVVADILEEAAQSIARDIGDDAIGIAFDAADNDSIKALVDASVKRFGRLDVLHNNHAKQDREMMEEDLNVLNTSFELWDASMTINLRSFFALCKFAIPHMIDSGGGSIIHMTSGSGLAGDDRGIAYGTSKAGIIGLSRYIATQHGKQGIRSNCISPGVVADKALLDAIRPFADMVEEHTLTRRLGDPADIAALVAFLASEEAGYITSQTYQVDGGLTSHQPYLVDLRRAGKAGKVHS